MAGSEKSGFSNSRPLLIENAYFILTPSPGIPKEKVDAYTAFAESLHSIPLVLDYQTHDQVTGTISHLPHIIAASLVNFVRDADTADELMKHLASKTSHESPLPPLPCGSTSARKTKTIFHGSLKTISGRYHRQRN